jgi:hypothetical protein
MIRPVTNPCKGTFMSEFIPVYYQPVNACNKKICKLNEHIFFIHMIDVIFIKM